MALPASDTFTRANQTPLGTASGGNAWTDLENGFKVASNAATGTSAVAQNTDYDSSDTFSADHYSQLTVSTSVDGGPMVRVSTGPNYYWYEAKTPGTSSLKKVVGGATTTLQSGLAVVANGSVLKITVTGTTIQLFKGGVQQGTDQVDASLASGAAGFGMFANSTVFDDWSADNNGGDTLLGQAAL